MISLLQSLSVSHILIIIMLSYILGGVISGFTWNYFKVLTRLVWWTNYKFTESEYLIESGQVKDLITKKKFISMKTRERLSYLVKKQVGDYDISSVIFLLLPYLRQYTPAAAAKAEYFMANKIMYRNLSFGFLLLTIALTQLAFKKQNLINAYSISSIATLLFSYLTILRSIVFYQWWSREILLGFYHHKLVGVDIVPELS